MKGYRTCHKYFSFDVQLPKNLESLKDRRFLISRVPLQSLYARIVSGYASGGVRHSLKKLRNTPHFSYVAGNKRDYREYLERFGMAVGYGADHSIETFESLLSTEAGYLAPPYVSHYIICERVKTLFGEKMVILDGVHRACQLLLQGVESIPVAILTGGQPGPLAQFDLYLADYKNDFPEWYTPIQLEGRIIHERTFPNFEERPEFLQNRERGSSKWEFIIDRNLPDLTGKSVCDIGCNCGLFAIYMMQRGARQVVGYDRSEFAVQPTNEGLPLQNVVEQAYFVRNLFRLAGTPNLDGLEFFACDLNHLDFSSLQHDVFFSCCVLYHFGERFEEAIRAIHQRIPEVFLQTNLGHKEPSLARYASIEYHRTLLEKYGYAVRIDAPQDYNYPVIYGKKSL